MNNRIGSLLFYALLFKTHLYKVTPGCNNLNEFFFILRCLIYFDLQRLMLVRE